ncbi:MAG TPA: hypothetical protein VGZ47_22100 [Gemmataceae bacterium]|nr:hypothetical protein [Gemmataceae bacterium]
MAHWLHHPSDYEQDFNSPERSPFADAEPPRGSPVHWVQPKLVAEIAFAEWTHHGRLRQPRFEGLRVDKKPRDCRKEKPAL